ncbi:hypothetical protein [Lentzea sp. NPDC004782]|uniref:hypothetical protein n=1 Tax=Lentzea sp. NPDC004782 TaxID=3154458 RepID=UPI0033BBE2E4
MRSVVLGGLLVTAALSAATPAQAQPLVSVGDVTVGDVTVAPVVVIGDVDVFEDVLEYVNIAALWSRASSLVTEGDPLLHP